MSASPSRSAGSSEPSRRVIRFNAFELDVRAGELRKHGIRLRARQQTLQVLQLLLERPGEVVLRQEIRDHLWPADTVVEFDHSINAAVQKLRDVLGDSAETPRYIETLKGRGYRLLASVEVKAVEPAREPVPLVVMPPPPPVPADALLPTELSVRQRNWKRLGLVAAFAGIACVAGWLAWRVQSPPVRNWTLPLGAMELPVVSPDGSRIIYRSSGGLSLRKLDSLVEVSLPAAHRPIDLPVWSPDGTHVAFPSLAGLVRMKVPDGPSVVISPIAWPTRGLSWGARNTILTAIIKAGLSELSQISAEGGSAVSITVPGLDGGRFFQPEFLPNGEDVLFGWNRDGDEEIGIYLATLREGRIARGPRLLRKSITAARFSPAGGGHLLFIQHDKLYAQKLNVSGGKLEGDPRPLVEPVFSVPGFRRPHFSVSQTGVLAWRAGTAALSQLTWFDRTGRVAASAGTAWDATSVSMAPDGRHVLVTGSNGRTVVAAADETGVTELPGLFGVRWMPNNTDLLYHDRSDGKSTRLMVRAVDGGPARQVAHLQGLMAVQDISPDGKALLYTTEQWTLHGARLDGPATTSMPLVNTQGRIFNAQFSPDGKWIVYSEGDRTRRVYLQRFPYGGIRTQISKDVGRSPVWRADGREILYLDGNTLYSVDIRFHAGAVRASPPVRLFDVHPSISLKGNSQPLAVSKDGSRILFLEATPDRPQRMSYVMTAWDQMLRP